MNALQGLLIAAATLGLGCILWLIFVDGRRRNVPTPLLLVAAADGLCGLAHFLLGGGHLIGVLSRAFTSHGLRGVARFHYDFRFYSLVTLGFLIAIPGMSCLSYVRRLTRSDRSAWIGAFESSIVLVLVNGPLIPMQRFALLLGALALINVVILITTRKLFVAAP